MTRIRHSVICLALAALCLLLVAGCGERVVVQETVLLQGTVKKGGQPLAVNKEQLGDYAHVEAVFIPEDGSHAGYGVKVQPDGAFTLATEDGRALPPGKYRVAVRQWEPYPQTDLLQGRYDKGNTPVIVEIAADTKEVHIDLDRPTG